jgi:hypothetical protein
MGILRNYISMTFISVHLHKWSILLSAESKQCHRHIGLGKAWFPAGWALWQSRIHLGSLRGHSSGKRHGQGIQKMLLFLAHFPSHP